MKRTTNKLENNFMRVDWEELAEKYSECRVFIEYANCHYEDFQKWLNNEVAELISKPSNHTDEG